MTFRSDTNYHPSVRQPFASISSSDCRPSKIHKHLLDSTKKYAAPLSSQPRTFTLKTSTYLSPNLVRVYSRIYESLGGHIKWKDNDPVLSPNLQKHFESVRLRVAQGEKIQIVMSAIVSLKTFRYRKTT